MQVQWADSTVPSAWQITHMSTGESFALCECLTYIDVAISQTDVFDILTSLDVSKASGIDNISPAIFKYCAAPLLHVICHLFSTSLQNNSIPQEWRTHCVIPISIRGINHQCLIIDPSPFFVFSQKCLKELFITVSSDMYKVSSRNINLAFYQIDQHCNSFYYLLKIFLKPSQR